MPGMVWRLVRSQFFISQVRGTKRPDGYPSADAPGCDGRRGDSATAEPPVGRIASRQLDVRHPTGIFSCLNSASTKAANARALAVGIRPVG